MSDTLVSLSTSPSLGGATAIKAIVNTFWATLNLTLPTCDVRLTPKVNVGTGSDEMPSAYVTPLSHKMERAGRGVMLHTLEFALVFIAEGTETSGRSLVNMMAATAWTILEIGVSGDYKFLSADVVDVCDQELLLASGIFRSQLNVTCQCVMQNAN